MWMVADMIDMEVTKHKETTETTGHLITQTLAVTMNATSCPYEPLATDTNKGNSPQTLVDIRHTKSISVDQLHRLDYNDHTYNEKNNFVLIASGDNK